MDFETKPVSELNITHHARPRMSPLRAAFAELPASLAMFLPRTGLAPDLKSFSNTRQSWLRKYHHDRKIHVYSDSEKNGVWVWWEPKETR